MRIWIRFRIQLITLMRIRIFFYAGADLGYQNDADPQHLCYGSAQGSNRHIPQKSFGGHHTVDRKKILSVALSIGRKIHDVLLCLGVCHHSDGQHGGGSDAPVLGLAPPTLHPGKGTASPPT